MIETGLVYIYSLFPARAFKGCGALLEGGYVATCRHVWRDAAPAGQPPSKEPAEVEIEFPFAEDSSVASRARLAHACEGLDARAPDLVLLKPDGIPGGIMSLQLAREAEFEIGPGQCHCCLKTRNIDSFIDGKISGRINAKGMRQFTGDNGQSHWMEPGSSGSPVFLEKGQQLAGIIALSELGANSGKSHLREAFIVPATTIHKYLRAIIERLAADSLAEKRGIDPAKLQPILAKLGQMDVPDDKIAERLDESVKDILAQAARPVPASNDGIDIDAAIVASRAKLKKLDTAGARDVLQAKLVEEERERVRRRVPLLKERAAVEQLAFDYDAAKQTLAEVARLAPDDVRAFIGLGDLYVTTGPLEDAAKAFRGAGEAARRQGLERDLSVSYERIGDVLVAQGNLPEALKSFRDGLAIADRLAKSDPGNAGWQRDLSVFYDNVGGVQKDQGDLSGALKSYSDSLAIAEQLAKSDPGNMEWQRDLSVSYINVGDVQKDQGDLSGALKSYSDSLAIRERLAKSDPGNAGWQRDLAVAWGMVGIVQQAQGNLPAALKSYRDGLVVFERFAKSDPGNAGWQRDLSVSYYKVGGVQEDQGDLPGALKSYSVSLAIADRLAKSDFGNAGWQRDLSVSYDNVGGVQQAQGDLKAALKSYEAKREIISRLAKSDPGNAEWQHDLSVSYAKLALVHKQSGDIAKAREFLRQGQAIMARLTRLSPDNATWKSDLARFDGAIAALDRENAEAPPPGKGKRKAR